MWSPHCGGTNLTKSPNIWRHRLSSLQFQIFWALTTYTCPDDHQVKVWELQLKLICELQGGSFRDKSPQFRTNGLPADDDDDSRSWPSHDILNHVQLDKSLVFVDRLAAGTNSWHSLLHLAPPRPIASNQLNSEKCCSPAPANAAGTIFGEFWSDLSTISVQSVFCWLGRFQEQLIDYWSDSAAPPFATDNQLLNLFIFCIWRLCFIFDHTWNTIPSTVLICKIWISLMSVKPVVARPQRVVVFQLRVG